MKRKPTKAQLREMLQQEIGAFEGGGGAVKSVNPGISGIKDGPLKAQEPIVFDGDKETRSYVNDVVAAIDARKKKTKKAPSNTRNKQPRRKLIYDDFGEPLRWVWEDE
jgi:hypothetical protein